MTLPTSNLGVVGRFEIAMFLRDVKWGSRGNAGGG